MKTMTRLFRGLFAALFSLMFALGVSHAEALTPYDAAHELYAAGMGNLVEPISPAGLVTTNSIPLGFLIESNGDLMGVLIDFNGDFSVSEVTGYTDFIPLTLTMITGTGAEEPEITSFTPVDLAGFGDAQGVHNYVLSSLFNTLDSYMRGYADKVNGPAGVNVRIDFYMWIDAHDDPLYMGAVEIPEYFMTLFQNF